MDKPLLNKDKALELLGGDEEMLLQIYDMFASYVPNMLGELEESIAKNDVNNIERLSHSLKSNAGTIGAETLREYAYKMEMSAKANDMKTFIRNFEDFKDLLKDVLKEIEAIKSA